VNMKRELKRSLCLVTGLLLCNAPAFCMASGRLLATQAVAGFAGEASGPLAYALSLCAIIGTSIALYRHHGEMGHIVQGAMGLLMICGIALGATSLMGFIPGVSGMTI
jgi:hypothetical protein